jgi:hypothetical protein
VAIKGRHGAQARGPKVLARFFQKALLTYL